MADYSQVNDYSAKDALATGNPLKLIKGSDVDQEFSALATAISSKFDSTDIATAGEAQAGVSNTVIITPARLTAWGQNDAGVIEDIQALSDPLADRILFWDTSASTTTWLTVAGMTLSGTTLTVADVLTGNGLSGGGTLTSDITLALDYANLVAATVVSGDLISFGDISDSSTVKKSTFANFEAALTIANMSDAATNGIDLSTITITAGSGLSYSVGGTDLTADATLDLDIAELTEETTIDSSLDMVAFYDASATANRKVPMDSLVGNALGDGKWYKSTETVLADDTEITVAFNTADYDTLTRGTFSTSTGEYTAGADGARVLISAYLNVTANENTGVEIRIEKNGVEVARTHDVHSEGPGTSISAPTISTTVSLAAGQVLRVRAYTGGGASLPSTPILSGQRNNGVSIVELG
jgi:hypothetical protein